MWKQKKYVREIDRYKLNLHCSCMSCKNYMENSENRLRYSCDIYKKENGIPPKIWNGDWAECEHCVPMEKKD